MNVDRRSAPAEPRITRKFAIIEGHTNAPGKPGFYRVQIAKKKSKEEVAVFVPVALRHEPPRDPDTGEPMDRSYLWSLEVAGELVAEPSVSHVLAFGRYVNNGWGLTGEVIDEAMYAYMLKTREWAAENAPWSPEANPRQSFDLNKLPSLF